MKSVMQHNFSQIPPVQIPRSTFDRSHGLKTTFNASGLYPIFLDEVLPGDTFNLRTNLFCRLATPLKPIMDNMFMETFFFFVPYRLVWENFKIFMGEKPTPGYAIEHEIPHMNMYVDALTLGDYFGIPSEAGETGLDVSTLPFRAYNLIWNEWFRDQNLQQPAAVPTDDGPDTVEEGNDEFKIRQRCKKHDYFTSCLPWPQKGIDVTIPLGDTAPVYGDGYALRIAAGNENGIMATSAGYPKTHEGAGSWPAGTSISSFDPFDSDLNVLSVGTKASLGNVNSGLLTDLTDATSATINSLRMAFQLQKLFERDARGGTRYTEIIRSHFGVVSPDARLQRPEYLGGSSCRININPVQQTQQSATPTANNVLGNLAAYGVAHDSTPSFTKSFTEHGLIIGLINVRADITYQQGLHRSWSRRDRYDFYWPSLAHLGEQEVLNKEIYAYGTEEDGNEVFGYQERYAEYRYKPSMITGKFRSGFGLDSWHLAEDFGDTPQLNLSFINDKSDITIQRAIAVNTEPQFLLDCYFDLKCARPMPVYSVPGLIDHF